MVGSHCSAPSPESSTAAMVVTARWRSQSLAYSLYRERSPPRRCYARRCEMVPGISDQWLVAIMIVAAASSMFGYVIMSGRRLDARIRRERERAAVEPQPGE